MKKWEMEVDEIDAILEKIWDIHDKLSDAIHSISKAHFTTTTTNNCKSHVNINNNIKNNGKNGCVYYKDIVDKDSAIVEAKSLHSIRSALENLEDHLEFFHTIQIQQRSERDAALARLEQSRIILALRLAEHSGKKCKVIDEAMEFVGGASCFARPEHLSDSNAQHPIPQRGHGSNVLVRFLVCGLTSAKQMLQVDKLGGIIGNAALFAVSVIALLHLHQVTCKDNNTGLELCSKHDRTETTPSRINGSSPSGRTTQLNVWLARG